jgi:hypothetical protein
MARSGFGSKDSDGTFGFKATSDGKVILGNTSDDIIQVTGSMDIKGFEATAPTSQDLGSGTISTLSITTSTMLLDADSITGEEMGEMMVHTMSVPNGTIHGQKLVLVVEAQFGGAGNIIIMLSGNFMGTVPVLMTGTQALEMVWISTASTSNWYVIT